VAINKIRNNNKDLLVELVKARFKLRYNNSILGFVWVLLKPLLYFLILYFVFTATGLVKNDSNYAANLFIGLILYMFFQEGVTFGMNSLLDMANVILKINFPRQIAVLSSLIMAMINLSVNFLIIIVIAMVLKFHPHLLGTLYCLGVILLETLLIYGISNFMSIFLVKVRDLTHIMELVFQLLFYASAVFYSMDTIHGNTGMIIRLNPLALMIDAARKGFVLNEITHVPEITVIAIITLIIIISGQVYFNRHIKKIAEYF